MRNLRKSRLQMGCGEALCGSQRHFRDLIHRNLARSAHQRRPPIGNAGPKGIRQGGTQISRKYANFIINTGDAGAGDISRLIACVQSQVERTSGVRLIPEVRRVGG